MTRSTAESGYFRNGLPYNSAGQGTFPLVIFPGLTFENKPQFGILFMYRFLESDFTLFSVLRKPGMPRGYSLGDMADDYAVMVRQEFGGPVDVPGISTTKVLLTGWALWRGLLLALAYS